MQMRRFGKSRDHDRRYKPRPGAYGILVRAGKILLTVQTEPRFEIQLPGGGIDLGESPQQALHREVIEETGWRIGDLRKFGAYRRFTYMEEYDLWAEKICHIYSALPVRAISVPLEPFHFCFWCDPYAALELLESRGDATVLEAYLQFGASALPVRG